MQYSCVRVCRCECVCVRVKLILTNNEDQKTMTMILKLLLLSWVPSNCAITFCFVSYFYLTCVAVCVWCVWFIVLYCVLISAT